MPTITEQREAAFAECKAPARYTSDPDVIDSPEEMAAVMAEWAAYFEAMRLIMVKYPFTEEEEARQPKPFCDSDD